MSIHSILLENIGMKQLVLDLRNNGGGLMDQALNLLDIFIDLVNIKNQTFT